MAADTRSEMATVTGELQEIEQQLEHLLERQQHLLSRQRQLRQVLKDEGSAANSDAQKGKWERADFAWSKSLEEKRRSVFGIDAFRPLQLQTMNTTMAGVDCMLVMPTGGGKSLCFQLTAVCSKGITLVVTPLVSLMHDQLYALDKLGVGAKTLNASSSKHEVNAVHSAMTDKNSSDLKLLYVTPEKLAKSKRFMNKLEKMYELGRFSRLVIDEVHCCSQWGHDFRPDYKFLGIMKKQFPRVPVLGLTATATSTVLSDVKKILGVQDCVVYKASFNRENLYYEVRSKPAAFKACMEDMCGLIRKRFNNMSGIVYCFSQKDTEEVSRELTSRGVRSACYHGNLDPAYRARVHTQWIQDKIKVVVATIAFGMGIDKPDVRFVIHHSVSKSMENYYQESGRAGRDSATSWCILYAGFQDIFRQSTMVFTEQTGLDKLYNMISYAYDLNTCRRSLIARHFGEKWESSDCNQMCDHCDQKREETIVNKDMSKPCRDVITTLHKHAGKTRMTGLKLLDAWLGKGKNSLFSRADGEAVLVYMLMSGYIREDFHFTAYTTISYLLPGSRENQLMRDDFKVEIPFLKPASRKVPAINKAKQQSSQDTKPKSRKSDGAKGSNTSGVKRKVVPCVVNTQNSTVSSDSLFLSEFKDKTEDTVKSSSTKSSSGNSSASKISSSKVKKKRVNVIDSDSDFLEFSEEDDFIPSKKTKLNTSKSDISNTSKKQSKDLNGVDKSSHAKNDFSGDEAGDFSLCNGDLVSMETDSVTSHSNQSNCIVLDDSDS